ncbi:MAG: YaiI/YqxD family protein [Candidatus Omnitrophica bacterium]|nr:YaiI/YqxD family protein [Candidatus Omnitrophota bacterium]
MLKIYIDADACPVKNEVYRVAERYKLNVTLVANSWMRVPDESWISMEVVGGNLDEADDWIVAQVKPRDIVITADILLAGRCLKEEAYVIGPNGKSFNEDNIGDAVAMRGLLSELRESGEMTGGPPPFQKKDRSNFLQELDRVIQLIRRENP